MSCSDYGAALASRYDLEKPTSGRLGVVDAREVEMLTMRSASALSYQMVLELSCDLT